MALLSCADSTPRAYKLKAGNADLPYFNIRRDIPGAKPDFHIKLPGAP
jgi:hypothetical protein